MWSAATLPVEPPDSVSLTTVLDAYLSKVERGPLRSVSGPTRWIRGAVYDGDGRLVVESQRIGGLNKSDNPAAADPMKVRVRPHAETLPGIWLYGGHWYQHFGHFLLESLTTLWPERLTVEGIVFHQGMPRPFEVEDWQRKLVDLAGFPDLPVRCVVRSPLRVERLLVPSRTVCLGGWAHPEAAAVWQRIPLPFRGAGGPARVYMSRTAWNLAHRASAPRRVRSTAKRDAAVDQAFTRAGFRTITPEALTIEEQIAEYAGAEVVAGLASSALHMAAACALPDARVLEVADARRPVGVTPTQSLVNAVLGRTQASIPTSVADEHLVDALAELGLAQK